VRGSRAAFPARTDGGVFDLPLLPPTIIRRGRVLAQCFSAFIWAGNSKEIVGSYAVTSYFPPDPQVLALKRCASALDRHHAILLKHPRWTRRKPFGIHWQPLFVPRWIDYWCPPV
jgi:hypothetical protein